MASSSLGLIIDRYNKTSLILRILMGLFIGAVLGLLTGRLGFISILGMLFVGALKGIAPILVACLVVSSIAQSKDQFDNRFALVIGLYLSSTFLASFAAVFASFLFPQTIQLGESAKAESIPAGMGEVLSDLLLGMVANPVEAVAQGRYIGILLWAVVFGSAANTAGVAVSLPTALVLSLIATLAACGASGVAGGSLLLVPMGCSLFGVPQDVLKHGIRRAFGEGYVCRYGLCQDRYEPERTNRVC